MAFLSTTDNEGGGGIPYGATAAARYAYNSFFPNKRTGGSNSVRVTSTERNDNRQSDEARGAKALIKCMNTLTFDTRHFAFTLFLAPLAVRKRFLSICIGFIVMHCSKFDNNGAESDEEFAFLVDCKRMQDVMMAYSIANNEFM